jgi:opacity protein-like surface antigen
MNRKGLVVFMVLAVLVAGNVSAQMPEFKLSAGAGGLFVSDFGGGYKTAITEIKNSYAGGGGFAFFDATFAELSFGFFATSGDLRRVTNGNTTEKDDISYTGLDISLLGKYPFTLSEQFTLFPLLGITYRHFVSVKSSSNPGTVEFYALKGSSALWFKLGVGADYAFTGHIFARLGVVYGIRLANKWEKDRVAAVSGRDTRLGHGLDVKLAVGYRF